MPTSYKFIPRFAALTRDVPPTSAPKIQWGYMTTTLHAEGKRAGVSPLLARFISPDSIVPRPGDVQAFNRYAYASWNPMRQVDTNGHADRDPQNDSLCQALPMVCAPQSPPLANETQMGESMSVQQAPIMTSKGAQVTLFAAKSGKDGNDGKGSGGGGLLGALLRLLGLGGGGGAGKVAQEVAKDGDPTNEVRLISDTASRAFQYDGRTLQHVFGRHARQMGFSGNWNSDNANAFAHFLKSHVESTSVQVVQGTYRSTQQVLHYYDSASRINVMTDLQGNLVSAWRLSQKQIEYLLKTGNVQ
jgi:RHS repeat-associated protein